MAKSEAKGGKTGNTIPQRVENAAQNMMNQASSGPRRGYIPPAGSGFTATQHTRNDGQNAQQPYVAGQSAMNGSQRGFIMPGKRIDYERTGRTVLDEFRGGKIGRITLEKA